jgi:hypothetical protein
MIAIRDLQELCWSLLLSGQLLLEAPAQTTAARTEFARLSRLELRSCAFTLSELRFGAQEEAL